MAAAADTGQVAQSLALRAKYKLPGADGVQIIPLRELGVHPQNRSGVFPPPTRVVDLLCNILELGFSSGEANHEGVCVQELPPEQHAAYEQKWGRPYETLHAYNCKCVRTVGPLSPAYTPTSPVQYGTLSHSTLALGLNCLRNGAVWDLPPDYAGKGLEKLRKQPGLEWDPDALARRDAQLGAALTHGLRFEVLSWKLWLEEASGACELISHALNVPQAIAMRTHEMEALAAMVELVDGQRAQRGTGPGAVDYAKVKQQLRRDHPHIVDDGCFQEMFRFVISTGSKKAGYVDRLLEFDRAFVNHRTRQLPLQAFQVVNDLSDHLPRTKVALLMRCYSKEARGGVCPTPEAQWGKIKPEVVKSLEDLLKYFQTTLAPAAACLGEEAARKLQCSVCLFATEAFILHSKPGDDRVAKPQQEMLKATLKYAQQLEAAVAPRPLAPPLQSWIDFAAAAAKAMEAQQAVAREPPQPRVVQFDAEDNPLTGQEASEAAVPPAPIKLPVAEWFHGEAARGLDTDHYHQSALSVLLATFHAQPASVQPKVNVLCDPRTSKYWAVASADVEAGGLTLVPASPTTKRFPLATNDPRAAAVNLHRKRPEPAQRNYTYFLPPDWKPPQCSPVAGGSRAAADEGSTLYVPPPAEAAGEGAEAPGPEYGFRFNGSESIHYFWAVERLTEDELLRKRALDPSCRGAEFNMELQTKEMLVVVQGFVAQFDPTVYPVQVPVLVSTKPVRAGDRLLVKVQPPPPGPPSRRRLGSGLCGSRRRRLARRTSRLRRRGRS